MAARTKEKVPFYQTKKAETMAKQYLKGLTMKDLADKYSVKVSDISEALRHLGVATRRGRQKVQ